MRRIRIRVGVLLLAIVSVGFWGAPASAQSDALVIGLATDPLNLDPRGAAHIIAWSVVYHIADPLVAKDKNAKIVPMLAESWDRPDPRTWRFRLRRDVKFHNGEPFTSESVKATIEAMLNPEQMKSQNVQISSQIAAGLRSIERVDTPDPHTAVIVTKTPFRPLPVNLSLLGMAPASAAKAGPSYVAHPVGTGPYKLVEYAPGSRVVLEANPAYWGPKPKFRRLTFRIMPENATRIAGLMSGELMGITNVPPDAIERIRGNKDLEVQSILTSRYTFLFLQNDRPPFNDRRVRLAVNHALNKEQINNGLYKGLARPAEAPMGPAAAFFNGGLRPYAFDLAKAKQLLAEAGYPNGLKITMGTPSGRFINDRQVGEASAAMLTRAGFSVDLRVEEWGTMLANMFARKYDAIYGAFHAWTARRMVN
jgi:peptide/nickel transport system substrate-binding protein